MKVAVIQFDVEFGKPQINYERVTERIREACKEMADVIVLPELWTTGYDLKMLDQVGDQNAEQTIEVISSLAETYHVNIIAGSIAKKSESGIYNTMLVFNRNGEVIKEYSKPHLFRLMKEEKFLAPGSTDGHFTIDDTQAAGFICYDIRFPEWIRKHVLENAKLLFVVAEWPKPRTDHWRTLLVARAIENQCFVIACNRIGEDPDNPFGGHSMIIDPWGKVLAEAAEEDTILYTEIDLKLLEETRARISVFEDRRTDLY